MTQLVWFRRDLRSTDHHALYKAQQSGNVIAVFIFDPDILNAFPKTHPALPLLFQAVVALKEALKSYHIPLLVLHARPIDAFSALLSQLAALGISTKAIFANEDYEPEAIARDCAVQDYCLAQGIPIYFYKDQVIFHKNEIVKSDGKPYSVFTPYKNAWLKRLTKAESVPFLSQVQADFLNLESLLQQSEFTYQQSYQQTFNMAYQQEGSSSSADLMSEKEADQALSRFKTKIAKYHQERDFPALEGTSRLSHHLRFGTLSVRKCVDLATSIPHEGASVWLNELIWREFYQQLLWHFPEIVNNAFKSHYRQLNYSADRELFEAWCQGRTGYPLIDAAMRELNQTGFMHNRLRMVVASFFCKDLLLDWRWGEQYFKETLRDFDLASNNGGWQWSASTGCDAQPYFRIFNPILQSSKFDPNGEFIRQYVPELAAFNHKDIHFPASAKQFPLGFKLGHDYPYPIVNHAEQRQKALALYAIKVRH